MFYFDLHRLFARESIIVDGLAGLATTVTTCSELEDELIHYSHGRHIEKSERASTPQSHKARSVQEYLRVFENLNANGVAQSYRYLCDITHPGAPSVWMWLAPMDTKGSEFVLSTDQDETIIDPHFPYQPCRACRNQQQ